MSTWFLMLAIVCISICMTGVLRRYALAYSLLDLPNMRSSHTLPTPRGGGLAIVISFLIGMVVLHVTGQVQPKHVFALGGSGILVALIGFLDDCRNIPAYWRLIVHFFAAGWGLFWLGGMPPLLVLGVSVDLNWFGQLMVGLCLVWLLNLYNFMDGIDGIAGIEVLTICAGGGVILCFVLEGGARESIALIWLLSASVLGFLVWNFPKAKIFMGDAGSGFIGLMLGMLAIVSANEHSQIFWCWLILLGVFVVDATVTLLRRILRRERVYEAHCSHAYQYASRKYQSHKIISIAVGIINIIWLLPVSILVSVEYLDGLLGMSIAYAPLVLVAIMFKAGAKELQWE
jgi:glycosyltransferase WbpL